MDGSGTTPPVGQVLCLRRRRRLTRNRYLAGQFGTGTGQEARFNTVEDALSVAAANPVRSSRTLAYIGPVLSTAAEDENQFSQNI